MTKKADILISNIHNRPCWWREQKALFHMWGLVEENLVGIIETEDGQVHEVSPSNIRFDSTCFPEYVFFGKEANND